MRCILVAIGLVAVASSVLSVAYGDDSDKAKSPFLSDLSLWPAECLAEFEKLTPEQQRYGTMMLSGVWPSSSVGAKDTITLFNDALRVRQVIGQRAFIADLGDSLVWIEGVGTSNLADDAIADCDGFAFAIVGNETYSTVIGGTKTVKKLQGFSTTEPDDLIQRVLAVHGYRMFRVRNVTEPWIVATVTGVTKVSVSLQSYGQRTQYKLNADNFYSDGIEWLSDKYNVKAMQKTKREFDAAQKLKPKSPK
jgi:hypothetical protein